MNKHADQSIVLQNKIHSLQKELVLEGTKCI